MNKTQILLLVLGASLLTFIISVAFSINMVSISPKNLAKVVKAEPLIFMEAIQEAAKMAQKQAQDKALEEQFKNPVEIPTKGRVTFGEASAPITIVEYSDFQCPYCQRAAMAVKGLMGKYNGQVKLIYKHMPLSFHPLARPAAEYFEAVALVSHEKARAFHDAIFDDFSSYAQLKKKSEINSQLQKLVKKLGLDLATVQANLKKAKKVVDADEEEAKNLGVNGTPSFFVNGVRTRDLEAVIERFLNSNS